MATSPVFQPAVEWAQRKDIVYVTIGVENLKEPQIDLADDKFHFRGRGGPDQREFDCLLEFYKPVDASKSRRIPSDRSIQYVIPKKESGPFWPRLLKTDKKMHWVKIDFNKWKDEDDESDEEAMNWDMNDMMGKMGSYGDANPDGGLDDTGDSDNEDLPDLEDDLPADDEDDKEKDEEEGGKSLKKDSKVETENGQHVITQTTAK